MPHTLLGWLTYEVSLKRKKFDFPHPLLRRNQQALSKNTNKKRHRMWQNQHPPSTTSLFRSQLQLYVNDPWKGKYHWDILLKGTLSGLRQFLAIKSPLKMVKNALYFASKSLFIHKFLSSLFGHVAKQLDQKDKVDFKLYDVTAWLTINFETHYCPISREIMGIR